MVINRDSIRVLLRKIATNPTARVALAHAGRAKLLPAGLWKRLPVEWSFSVDLPNGNSFLYSSILEEGIGRALFWRGWNAYEPEVATIFFRLAQVSKVVIDIGAHTGFYTLLACAANPNLQCVCFEPVPFIHQRLSNHIKMNGWEMRCDARREAVSNKAGIAKLHVPSGKQPVSASLHSNGFIVHEGTQIEVAVTTIDVLASSVPYIDLVKIDAEGYEDKILEGMKEVIARSKPYIIVECMPDGPFEQVDSLMREYKYRVYHLDKAGPIPIQKIIPDPNRTYPNYLCTPSELPREIL